MGGVAYCHALLGPLEALWFGILPLADSRSQTSVDLALTMQRRSAIQTSFEASSKPLTQRKDSNAKKASKEGNR